MLNTRLVFDFQLSGSQEALVITSVLSYLIQQPEKLFGMYYVQKFARQLCDAPHCYTYNMFCLF